ncbi:EF_hand domain-containing protein [Hexamita inflata]|uniref:EF hand domain-containing protein n=1 Tax=Hexamita inflata TaxID=28002 RepID=A0AA86PF54_9EUKA|nr:EF hand domain-containing protein [Hexamita inflata]
MSQKIEKPDFASCEKAFKAIDSDRSDNLDLDELKKAFELLEMHLSKDEIKSIVEIVDTDGDGQMNCKEFVHFVYICKNADPKDVKTILFLAADLDCSGTIDKNELRMILKKLGATVTEQQIDDLMDVVADNKDGTISYEMFIALLDKILDFK